MNKFDRLSDWKSFNKKMEEYIEIPQKKYGSELKFNDLCHYTGLRIMLFAITLGLVRIMLWNILKYALRLWSGCGKEHDFEKIAHYAQMGFCLKERQGRVAPFFKEDVEGDYVVPDMEMPLPSTCPDRDRSSYAIFSGKVGLNIKN